MLPATLEICVRECPRTSPSPAMSMGFSRVPTGNDRRDLMAFVRVFILVIPDAIDALILVEVAMMSSKPGNLNDFTV